MGTVEGRNIKLSNCQNHHYSQGNFWSLSLRTFETGSKLSQLIGHWKRKASKVKDKVCIRVKWSITLGFISSFSSMKQLGVFILPPGWDVSQSHGYPSALNSPVPIYTPGWREALWELSVLLKNTTQCPRPGLDLDRSIGSWATSTMRPPNLHKKMSKW